MIVLDASVVIAAADRTDEHHVAATELMLRHTPGSMLIHPLTLAETLVAPARAGVATEFAADLAAAGVVVSQLDEDEPIRLATLRATSGLKLPDCCVVNLAQRTDAELATFDMVLAQRARTLGIHVVP